MNKVRPATVGGWDGLQYVVDDADGAVLDTNDRVVV
jgi:hypothetical protein